MKNKIVGIFVMGILILTGFASITSQAGPALQPLTSPDPQIVDMIQQVNESLLYDYLAHVTAFGPHVTGTENSMKVSQYIYDEFQTMGLAVEFHEWTFDKFTDRNVVATLPGTDLSSNATFVFCAHHDTVDVSPGADDDGSGVAAVLTTAKILSQYSFPYTIRFITFSGEEQGLYGSHMYVRDADQRGDNIVAVISPDMIGCANTSEEGQLLNFWYAEYSMWIGDFVRTVSMIYRNQIAMIAMTAPLKACTSDFQSFAKYGFDAIFPIIFGEDYFAHTANDTIDRINFTYLTKATKFLLAVIAELASTPIELQVMITTPYEGFFYFNNNPLFPLVFKGYHLLQLERITAFYKILGLRGTTVILGTANLNVDVIPLLNDIKYVCLCIDGGPRYVQPGGSTHYQWAIPGPYIPIGRHSVEIYAGDSSGNVASDAINVIIY
jgi:hypothetical protein